MSKCSVNSLLPNFIYSPVHAGKGKMVTGGVSKPRQFNRKLLRKVHTYQMLSGKTNAVNSFLLTGSKLYLPSDSGLGFFAGDDCTGSSVLR